MSDFYKKILDDNKQWVVNALEKDPNFFADLAKDKRRHYYGLVVQIVVFLQMKSLALSQVKFLFIEISQTWLCIQI